MPRVPRINYQKLNSTGERVPVIEDQLSTQLQNLSINDSLASIEMSTPSGDAIDLMVMSQTVMHIIDEYPINNMGLDQVNVVVDKLEKLRMDILKAQMRVNISKEELPEDCKLSINQSLLSIKEFMKTAADIKEKLYLRSQKLHVDEAIKNERTVAFLLDGVKKSMEYFNVIQLVLIQIRYSPGELKYQQPTKRMRRFEKTTNNVWRHLSRVQISS